MSYNKAIFTKGTNQYKDIDLSFRFNPITKDIRIATDDAAIKQSLKNIVYTLAGDRPFDPEFGAGIHGLLFELFDELTKQEIESTLYRAIQYHEPRVKLENVSVGGETDLNQLDIKIYYSLVNMSIPQTLNIILNRTR